MRENINDQKIEINTEENEVDVLENRSDSREDKTLLLLKDDASLSRFGKFHLFSRTIIYAVAKTAFVSTIHDIENKSTVVKRTSLEISKVLENQSEITRIIIGRLYISVAK